MANRELVKEAVRRIVGNAAYAAADFDDGTKVLDHVGPAYEAWRSDTRQTVDDYDRYAVVKALHDLGYEW